MVGAYDNDKRVRQVSDTKYELLSPEGWVVWYDSIIGKWSGDATSRGYGSPLFGESADAVIGQIIGDPR